jgi:hypothetical protein
VPLLIATVGIAFTTTVTATTPLHTFVPVPETVYTVVTDGLTLNVVELELGDVHV